MSTARLRVAFVLEQHVGHRTYAENLRKVVEQHSDIQPVWIPVAYAPRRSSGPRWGPLQSTLDGRREVRRGLRGADAQVHVFNTQVPAAIAGRVARRRPYVAITDVTPAQYDAMAEGYGHRPDRGPLRWWKHQVNQRVFRGAHRCVAWSAWAAESIVADYGADPARVVVVSPGVDTSAFTPAEPRRGGVPRILFVGGEFHRKGGDLLVDAWRPLAGRSELWLVTKSAPRDLYRTPGIHVVDDLGPNDPRLVDLYRSAAVFALPSRAETFGIAALEAASTGLPVVATRIGGLAEIPIDGVTGIMIDVDDGRELSAALERLVDDAALRDRLGHAARARAIEHFDADRNGDRLLAIVGEVARGVGP